MNDAQVEEMLTLARLMAESIDDRVGSVLLELDRFCGLIEDLAKKMRERRPRVPGKIGRPRESGSLASMAESALHDLAIEWPDETFSPRDIATSLFDDEATIRRVQMLGTALKYLSRRANATIEEVGRARYRAKAQSAGESQ